MLQKTASKTAKVWIVVAVLLSSTTAQTEETAMTRIAIFKDAVGAVGAAGDAIAKITDGVRHLVVTGVSGYKYVSAEREYNRLRDISARGTNLAGIQQQAIVRSIDEYLAKPDPTAADWDFIRLRIQQVIVDVKRLLDDVRTERSDFVLEEAYGKLGDSLGSRSIMLDKISRLPQPITQQERDEVAKLNKEYKRLLANFRAAIEQLNLYLKQQKKG